MNNGLPSVMHGKSRTPQADALFASLCERIDGGRIATPIPHSEIERIIGEKHRTDAYGAIVTKARKRLLSERGYVLLSLHCTGYQIADGAQQIRAGVGYVKRASKSLKRGVQVIGSVDKKRLDEKSLEARDRMMTQLSQLNDAAKMQVQTLRLTTAKE